MVFNATFNNISVKLWRSVLLVKETRVPGENHWPVASHWPNLLHNVSSTPRLGRIRTHNLVAIGTDYIGSYKSNYDMITTTTASNRTSNYPKKMTNLTWRLLQGSTVQHYYAISNIVNICINKNWNPPPFLITVPAI